MTILRQEQLLPLHAGSFHYSVILWTGSIWFKTWTPTRLERSSAISELLIVSSNIQKPIFSLQHSQNECFIAVSQQLIGDVDVTTKSVHFYVQRNTDFSANDVIPWEVVRLNEGGDMDLSSRICHLWFKKGTVLTLLIRQLEINK